MKQIKTMNSLFERFKKKQVVPKPEQPAGKGGYRRTSWHARSAKAKE